MNRIPKFCKPPIFLVACFVVYLGGCQQKKADPVELLQTAKREITEENRDSAIKHISQIPEDAPQWLQAMLFLAEVESKKGDLTQALETYKKILSVAPSTADMDLVKFSTAEVHLQLGQLYQAKSLYAEVFKAIPNDGITNERMAFLLSLSGKRWDALDHYFVLIKRGDATFRELALAADVGRALEHAEFLEKCQSQAPDDLLVQQAIAAHAFENGNVSARPLLEKLVQEHPESLAPQAMLGELLVEEPLFVHWHEALPANADTSPDIWYVRGLWSRQQGDLEVAAECFWQAVTRMPFYRRAYYMLGQTLIALDDPEAERIAAYSSKLIELSQTIDSVLLTEGGSEKSFHKTAELLESLGRIWEACAWGIVARQRFPNSKWPSELFAQHSHKLGDDLPRIVSSVDPTFRHKEHTVPSFTELLQKYSSEKKPLIASTDHAPKCQVQFQLANVIDFNYFNADDPTTKGLRTFEQTGGGVAVLDFDADGMPDLFLTQGTEWKTGSPLPSPSGKLNDHLYRNQGGKDFVDASQFLGPDSGYGQGCAAGDFNNDGFSDLYVANVGANALYENMGDGTFRQVTEAGLMDESWTASVMICDLNADDLPDLYDANYLQGDGVYERICQGRACSPSNFAAAPDRVYINLGNGQFEQLEDLPTSSNSKGLGVIAFELETNRRPTVFVANDQVANHFLSNRSSENKHDIELSDDALAMGVAYNENGLAMACMGITVADFDANNHLDIFVTNFLNESNTVYFQDAPSLFVDATRTTGMQSVSLAYTGWGTQALDADLDGWPDLVVTNGHVDDYRDEGGPYHMQPQLFQNHEGAFQECSSDKLGSWFQEKYLGRGLAKVDWNQDGRPEFVVSNVNQPASVLINTTETDGRYVSFRLSAIGSSRDATGVRVFVKTNERTFQQQVVAGDGYMASNEKLLHFGLGDAERIESATIRWPSGETSELQDVPLDSLVISLERLPTATIKNKSRHTSIPVTLGQ